MRALGAFRHHCQDSSPRGTNGPPEDDDSPRRRRASAGEVFGGDEGRCRGRDHLRRVRHHEQRPDRVLLVLRCLPGVGRCGGGATVGRGPAAPAPAHSGSGPVARDGRSGRPSGTGGTRIPLPDPGDRSAAGRPCRPQRPHRRRTSRRPMSHRPRRPTPADSATPSSPRRAARWRSNRPAPIRWFAAGAVATRRPRVRVRTAARSTGPNCASAAAAVISSSPRIRIGRGRPRPRPAEAAVVATVDPAELATGLRCARRGSQARVPAEPADGAAGPPVGLPRRGARADHRPAVPDRRQPGELDEGPDRRHQGHRRRSAGRAGGDRTCGRTTSGVPGRPGAGPAGHGVGSASGGRPAMPAPASRPASRHRPVRSVRSC